MMTAAQQVDYFIKKYGNKISIVGSEETISCSAFIQPFLYKNRQYLSGTYKPEGYENIKYFIYIGSADYDLGSMDANTYIEDAAGDKYVVRRSEMIYFKNAPCYCWAILKHSVGVTNASLSQ